MMAPPVLTFGDIKEGQVYCSPGRTLTETDLMLYMMWCGDWDPIHADQDYMAATARGQRLLHGTMGIGLAMAMQASAVRFADPLLGALGLANWKFHAPLMIGETVRTQVLIKAKRITSDSRRYVVERELTLLGARGNAIQSGEAAALLQLESSENPD